MIDFLFTSAKYLIRIGRERKQTGAVVRLENVEIEIAEEKTRMHELVNVGQIAERDARRIVGQIARLVPEVVRTRNTRRLN